MSASAEIWLERLASLEGPTEESIGESSDEALWEQFEAQGEDLRAEVARGLQAAVMAAVRTNPPQALPLSERLLRAARGLDAVLALSARGRAVALHANGHSEEAAAAYGQALDWYVAKGEELEAARVRRSLVDALQMAGHAEAALEQANLARPALKDLEEWRLLAQLECNVGNVYFRLDRYDAARPHYEEARDLFEREGDVFGRAHALYNLGNIETNAHSFKPAEECFTIAKEAFLEVGHTVLAADCDYALGYLNIRRGRFAEAYRELLSARDGYGAGGKPSGQPLCDLDLCELHIRMDAHYDALTFGRRAVDGFDGLGMRYEAAKARMLLGMASIQLRRESEGEQHLSIAAQEFAAIGNHTLGALATLHRVALPNEAIGARSALVEVQAAAEYLQASGDEYLGQIAQLALADGLQRAGQSDAARQSLLLLAKQQDADAYERLGLPNVRIEALRSLASMELDAGATGAAEQHLRTAVGWIDATLSYLTNGDARLAFFARRQPAFAELASLLLDGGDPEAAAEAVRLIERSRSRNMAQRQMQAHAGTQVRAARERVDFLLRERWESILGGNDRTPGGPRGLAAPADDALREAQEQLLEMDRQGRSGTDSETDSGHGKTADSKRKPEGIWDDRAPSVAALAQTDRALYFLTARNLTYGVLLGKRSGAMEVLHIECLGAIDTELRRQLSRARYFVEKRELGARYSARQSKAARTGLLSSLGRMGELLLAPFINPGEKSAPEENGLVVIPYGLLHSVPFAGLMRAGQPLVDSCDVSVARSLKSLRPEVEHRLGNRGVLSCGGAAGDLPEIERELSRISTLAGADHRILEAPDFLSAVRSSMKESVLHIPGHGNYEPDHPLFAGLQLGGQLLAAYDVARLELPPCLVILSGCETGRQSMAHGEELHGVEQAFFTAGAVGVLGSLWPISDAGGADLISAFVEHFLGGSCARSALSKAQRAAWRSDAHLEDWTSLVYAGDPYLESAQGPASDGK
ncbi:MAG: CHAT domain-containing protein [Gammaproteobacteria bacterium]